MRRLIILLAFLFCLIASAEMLTHKRKAFQTSTSTLNSGLIAYYNLDDISGAYSVTNTSGTAMGNGVPTGPNETGVVKSAGGGPGGKDALVLPREAVISIESSAMTGLTNFTVNIWMRETTNSWWYMEDPDGEGGEDPYPVMSSGHYAMFGACKSNIWGPPAHMVISYIEWGSDYLSTAFSGGYRSAGISQDIIPDAQWIMLTMMSSGNASKLYTNGVLCVSGTTTSGTLNASDRITLGGIYSDTYAGAFDDPLWDCMEGKLALFGLWGRALSSGELTELYNTGSGLSYGDFAP